MTSDEKEKKKERYFPIDQVENFLNKNVDMAKQKDAHDRLIQLKQKSDKISTSKMKEFLVEYWNDESIQYENE